MALGQDLLGDNDALELIVYYTELAMSLSVSPYSPPPDLECMTNFSEALVSAT